MFEQLVAINKDTHAKKKLKPVDTFHFAQGIHLASVMVPEFARAASSYPVVFLEDKEAGTFRPVALMGFQNGENLYIDDAGKWQAPYIPAIIRRYPFSLARTDDAGQFLVCLDGDTELLSDSEGTALFDDAGNASPLLETARNFLGELQQMETLTLDFCKFLASQNLFTPLNIRVPDGKEMRDLTGCYGVNEERLKNLSAEVSQSLRDKNYLPAIYAHLVSLFQIDRLTMMREVRRAQAVAAAPKKSAAH